MCNTSNSPSLKERVQCYINKEDEINIIMSENYQNTNGFFQNNWKNWNYMIDNIIKF